MPFCPKCRYEYKDGIVTCPDCEEELVASLPEDTEKGEDREYDWVQLAKLTSQQYADMVVEVLRSKNIPAVALSSAGHFGQTGQMGISSFRPVGGAYTLMVPREYIADADKEGELILGDDWEKCKVENVDD